ncbi:MULTISPECIES: type III secretion system co-regulatory protein PtrC [Pseudomonas]|uniref:type III secretion system co-regulatory protein PtrC n=1 Tax=Pseudomonas TaxID=286 RepID=UPI0025806E49|nr:MULTISPECIES: type III secretion system co-regulatory protein PtrC [Pseudomonas]
MTNILHSKRAYGVTYVTLSDAGLKFESEAALHLEDGGLMTLKVPTLHSERLAVHDLLCLQNGICQAA